MSALLYFAGGVAMLLLAQAVRRFSWATALVLLLIPLAFTARALLTGGVYGPVDLAYTTEPLASIADRAGIGTVANSAISDVYTEFFPWNDALRRALRRGQWPLWNPYELCGTPLAGAAQVAPYHPITILGLLIPLPEYFAFAAAMLYLVAATSAFLLARELTESDLAALFGAVAWCASTHIIFFAGTALANGVSVMPLVLLGGRRVVLEPGRRSMTVLTVALVVLVLSGHPETVLHAVVFGCAYVVFEIARTRPPRLVRVLVAGLTSGGAAVLLCAVFLLPHFEAISQSEEYIHRALGYEQKPSTPAQLRHRLRANFFPFLEGGPGVEEQRHAPDVRHGWLATLYAGTLVFGPALYGVWRGRTVSRWFFAGSAVWGLGAGVSAPGFVHLFNWLPGFNLAVNEYVIAVAVLGMAMLAAIGIDRLNRQLAGVLCIVAVIVAAAALLPAAVSPDYLRMGAVRAIAPVVLAVVAILVLDRRAAAGAFVGLLLLQRVAEAFWMQPTVPRRAFYPEFPGLALMRSAEPFRIVGVGNMLPPALATHYGLEDVRGFQALTLGRYDTLYPLWSTRQPVWFNRVDDLSAPLLSMMNVRFALVPADSVLPQWWIVRGSFGGYRVAENTRVIPRAFVPRRIHYTTRNQALDLSSTDDFAKLAVIETGWIERNVPNGPGIVTTRTDGGRVVMRAVMESAGWIVVSNTVWKGWRATVDGRKADIRAANHAFVGVHVPAGDHRVELTYRPRSFEVGAAVSLVTLLGCLVTLLIRPSPSSYRSKRPVLPTACAKDTRDGRWA